MSVNLAALTRLRAPALTWQAVATFEVCARAWAQHYGPDGVRPLDLPTLVDRVVRGCVLQLLSRPVIERHDPSIIGQVCSAHWEMWHQAEVLRGFDDQALLDRIVMAVYWTVCDAAPLAAPHRTQMAWTASIRRTSIQMAGVADMVELPPEGLGDLSVPWVVTLIDTDVVADRPRQALAAHSAGLGLTLATGRPVEQVNVISPLQRTVGLWPIDHVSSRAVAGRFAAIADAIERSPALSPARGVWCTGCPYRRACPAHPDRVGYEHTEEELQQLMAGLDDGEEDDEEEDGPQLTAEDLL